MKFAEMPRGYHWEVENGKGAEIWTLYRKPLIGKKKQILSAKVNHAMEKLDTYAAVVVRFMYYLDGFNIHEISDTSLADIVRCCSVLDLTRPGLHVTAIFVDVYTKTVANGSSMEGQNVGSGGVGGHTAADNGTGHVSGSDAASNTKSSNVKKNGDGDSVIVMLENKYMN